MIRRFQKLIDGESKILLVTVPCKPAMERQDLPCTYIQLIMSWKASILSLPLQLLMLVQGRTCLMYAAYNGHLDVATILLANRADSTAQDHKVS